MAVGAQEHAALIFGLREVLLVDGFGIQAETFPRTVRFEVALDGHHREIVLRLTEDAALRLSDADDFVRRAFDGNEFADGVRAGEEGGPQVIANEHDRRVPAHLLERDAAADIDLNVGDRGNVLPQCKTGVSRARAGAVAGRWRPLVYAHSAPSISCAPPRRFVHEFVPARQSRRHSSDQKFCT